MKVVGKCGICHLDLLAAPGQVVRFHRECRKEGKKRFGKTREVRQFKLTEFGTLVPQTGVITGQ